MKSWLHGSTIEMYSTHNKGKCAVPERFVRTLKNKIYKHMNAVPKINKLPINKLDEIVEKWNNTYHRAIKIKPADVGLGT